MQARHKVICIFSHPCGSTAPVGTRCHRLPTSPPSARSARTKTPRWRNMAQGAGHKVWVGFMVPWPRTQLLRLGMTGGMTGVCVYKYIYIVCGCEYVWIDRRERWCKRRLWFGCLTLFRACSKFPKASEPKATMVSMPSFDIQQKTTTHSRIIPNQGDKKD